MRDDSGLYRYQLAATKADAAVLHSAGLDKVGIFDHSGDKEKSAAVKAFKVLHCCHIRLHAVATARISPCASRTFGEDASNRSVRVLVHRNGYA